MMKSKSIESSPRSAGFTLVELLVVMLIVVVLAVISTGFIRSGIARAESAKAMSNLRQCGVILLTKALEKNNRLSLFSGGASGGFDQRAYNIVRDYLGNSQGTWNNQLQNRSDIMHWNPKKTPPSNFHWDCYAVNFTDVERLGVRWQIDNGRQDGSNGRVLSIPSVQRPEDYPILLDSSTASGREIFRVGIVGTELPGLRNQGKANAFFLDGSAKSLDKEGLKKAGFSTAYDNSVSPPRLINL
jgi:prepilin-type N-terminal cleavage/methylation domain-containing protein/prepilin-type processing-associated H-X9-DG protein